MTQPKRRTSKDYLARFQEQAREAFKDHVIRSRDARSWLCFKPYTDEKGGWHSTFWFEVIVLAGGELYVHGDISGVHFAHYGSHTNPEQVLRWMGGRASVDGYVMEKARIGMSLPNAATITLEITDEGVWLDEALDYIESSILDTKGLLAQVDQEDLDLEPYRDQIPEWLMDMVGQVLDGDDLAEIFASNEFASGEAYEAGALRWGEVPSTRLIYAHEALRALVRLLDAEQTKAAPATTEATGA